MERVREKILRAAIAHYGRGPQQLKAIEELSELIQALAKADDPDNIAEEMAAGNLTTAEADDLRKYLRNEG